MSPMLRRVLIGLSVVLPLIMVLELLPLLPLDSVQPRTIVWPPQPERAILSVSQTNKTLLSAVAEALSVSTVTWESFRGVTTSHDEDLVWYCGSAANYDYFQLNPGPLSRSKSHVHRVSSANAPLKVRFPLSASGSKWISWVHAAGLTHGIAQK